MRNITLVSALMFALVACAAAKKDDKGTTTSPNPGDNPDPSAPGKDAGPANQTECLHACETQYPKAALLAKQLDVCMTGEEGACTEVCNNLGTGVKLVEPDVDAGATCNTKAAKSYPITTASQACSNCLAGNAGCCKTWISIFSSEDGKALNTCANACYTNFKN